MRSSSSDHGGKVEETIWVKHIYCLCVSRTQSTEHVRDGGERRAGAIARGQAMRRS